LQFGGAKQKLVMLAQQHVTTLGNRLPDDVQSVCNAEQFRSDGQFRNNSTGSYKVTRLTFDKAYIYLNARLYYLTALFNKRLSLYSAGQGELFMSLSFLFSSHVSSPTPTFFTRAILGGAFPSREK
jgi:hypothetical protein